MFNYELLAIRKYIGFYVHSKKYQTPLTSTVSLINIMWNQTRPLRACQFSTEFVILTWYKIVSLLYTFYLGQRCTNFLKSGSHLKILGNRRVTRSGFCSENLQILGRHNTKFSRHGDLATWLCKHLILDFNFSEIPLAPPALLHK
jgi:hypothetical protein